MTTYKTIKTGDRFSFLSPHSGVQYSGRVVGKYRTSKRAGSQEFVTLRTDYRDEWAGSMYNCSNVDVRIEQLLPA